VGVVPAGPSGPVGGSDQPGEGQARLGACPVRTPHGPLGLLLRPDHLVDQARAPVLLCVLQPAPTMGTGEIFLK